MLIQGIYYFIYFFALTSGQIVNNCASKENCGNCIQEIGCEWCIEPISADEPGRVPVHCRPKNENSSWCTKDMLISPKTEFQNLIDAEFSNDIDNPTQVRPQRVKLSLRKGEKYDLKFKFKNAANYPVDLYYIMDLSKSMEAYKATLANLGIELANTMRSITTNFRLGFGSFIDKVDLPFVSTVPERLKSPCVIANGISCASPYSFKNHMALTSNYTEFVNEVNSAKVSGNLDSPEGGLDAIMQAIVCKDKIKWRDQARHLLVFSTDAEFHIAGDGKLAGVVEPNPARCYTNDSEYLIYDYPSVSQIDYVAGENNINIVFAIVKKPRYGISTSYRRLSENIKNSNFGELDEKGGSNVVKLVKDNYYKIVQSVKFTHNAPNEVDIKFSSNCNSTIQDRCNNVHVGQELEFQATIQLRECPQDGQKTKLISIRPEAINESLIVELELLCECPCASNDDSTFVANSDKCYGVGDLKCGVCDCSEGRFGRNCQCDSSQSSSENITNCIMEGTTDICSGFGICKCGKCECNTNPNNVNERIYGQFCECDNYSCKKEGGVLCSGRGKCNCKKCDCQAGFSGNECECDESTVNCVAPGTSSICSDHGTCVCGHCECEMIDNNRYSGKYCEDCTSCPAQRCEELRHCVQCQVYKSGIYEKICDTECTAFTTIVLHSLDSDNIEDIKKCRIPDNDTCIINFDYYYEEDNKLVVRALDRKICPEPPNVLAWTLGVIASILLAGLILLLIWKVYTSIHDKREYEKFENERKKMKWGTNDNPLYKGATSSFANPAYKRGSVRFSMRKD